MVAQHHGTADLLGFVLGLHHLLIDFVGGGKMVEFIAYHRNRKADDSEAFLLPLSVQHFDVAFLIVFSIVERLDVFFKLLDDLMSYFLSVIIVVEDEYIVVTSHVPNEVLLRAIFPNCFPKHLGKESNQQVCLVEAVIVGVGLELIDV